MGAFLGNVCWLKPWSCKNCIFQVHPIEFFLGCYKRIINWSYLQFNILLKTFNYFDWSLRPIALDQWSCELFCPSIEVHREGSTTAIPQSTGIDDSWSVRFFVLLSRVTAFSWVFFSPPGKIILLLYPIGSQCIGEIVIFLIYLPYNLLMLII